MNLRFFVSVLLATVALASPSIPRPPRFDLEYPAVDTWLDPPPAFGGFEAFHNAVLAARSDRWDVVPSSGADGAARAACQPGTAILISDLCAMGHLTKDAAMVASWLLDHVRTVTDDEATMAPGGRGERRVDPASLPPVSRIIFGNKCMARVSGEGEKRSPLFHNVIQHWFLAVLAQGGNVNATRLAATASPPRVVEVLSTFVAQTPLEFSPGGHKLKLEIVFADDLERFNQGRSASDKVCFEAVVKRGPERWRWFRTRAHADWFRRRLWAYFQVPHRSIEAKDEEGRPRALQVSVLVRDEDRHFDEARVATMLAAHFSTRTVAGCRVTVQLHKFDRIKGATKPPPTHPEQIRILGHDTDVLLAAHGAGLAAVIAMRPRTAVIELFPNNFRYHMYQELAELASLQYTPYESRVVHPPGCCAGRGGDLLPVLRKPHDGNGVGARACKKCDTLISDEELIALITDGLMSAARAPAHP